MGSQVRLNTKILTLTVLVLVSCFTQIAKASLNGVQTGAPVELAHKTFAVFVAAYNAKTGEVRGGVAGTAFFTANNKAITAFHVLQPASFTHAQVWLVHENEPAIELSSSDISSRADQDLTAINLGKDRNVSDAYVFKTRSAAALEPMASVHTGGIKANTGGPILALNGGRLVIQSVPSLVRLKANGHITQRAQINLNANDVRLKSANCLQLSYQPVIGLSGGPVVSNGQVIGMNSFADPGTRATTWAVEIPL